jgi:hypothetical protein
MEETLMHSLVLFLSGYDNVYGQGTNMKMIADDFLAKIELVAKISQCSHSPRGLNDPNNDSPNSGVKHESILGYW